MRMTVSSISLNKDAYDSKTEVTFRGTHVSGNAMGMAGHEVYIYPKSRWSMFLDWLLRA